MRNGKRIMLCGIMTVFVIITVFMDYYIKKDAERSSDCNFYGLCINEVCSDYFPVSFTETQPPSDWIELYNFSDTSKNLGEYYLSDDKKDLHKCNLPAVELMPGSYYVIHSECDEMTDEAERLNFGIKAQGETIYLSDSTGGGNRRCERSGNGCQYSVEPSDGCREQMGNYGTDLLFFE